MKALVLVVVALAACGKKSSPPATRDDAAVTAPSAPAAPSLPSEVRDVAPVIDASIATRITPPPASAFGHFCVNINGRSKCVTTEEECKKLAPRCGQWKSVFCFKVPTGPVCFSSTEDCKQARSEAAKAGEQVASECVQDEM